jgi:hypothetical protein
MYQDQFVKSQLNMTNTYNEKVFFNIQDDKENIPEEFQDQLHQIISNVIAARKSNRKNPERLSSGNSFNKNNTNAIRVTGNQRPSHNKIINDTFMEKMRKPASKAIKLNLNISNNYYNVCENNGDTPTTPKMDGDRLSSKISAPLNLQNDSKRENLHPSRFTVFLSNF